MLQSGLLQLSFVLEFSFLSIYIDHNVMTAVGLLACDYESQNHIQMVFQSFQNRVFRGFKVKKKIVKEFPIPSNSLRLHVVGSGCRLYLLYNY